LQVFRRHGAIPRYREKTLRKNKKAWGVGFKPWVCRFLVYRFASFRRYGAIYGDREKTMRKNNKAQSYPRDREKTIRKNKKVWGVEFNPRVCRFQVCRNHKGITRFWKIFSNKCTKEHHPRNLKARGRSISTRIGRRVSSVITHPMSPGSVAF